jgi:hypothetical protein
VADFRDGSKNIKFPELFGRAEHLNALEKEVTPLWLFPPGGQGDKSLPLLLNPDSEGQSNKQRKPRKKNKRGTPKWFFLRVFFLRGCKGAEAEPQVHPLNRLYPAGCDRKINSTSESRLNAGFPGS